MGKICQVTGKKPSTGFKYAIRGIAKKKKGIGLKVTGKTRRRFEPNLLKKKFWSPEENRWIHFKKISAAGLRTVDRLGVTAVVRKLRTQGIKI